MNNHQNSIYQPIYNFVALLTNKFFIKRVSHLLLTLSMVVLISGCNSNLKPETQGKKMTTFFNNNNTSLPKLSHHKKTPTLTTTKQSLAISKQSLQPRPNAEFVKNQSKDQETQQALKAEFVKTNTTQQRLKAEFIRAQATELENNFPKHPNPTLNMFVYPHLTQDGNPVPGYTTHFKLYKTDHYALPQEAL